MTIYIIVHEHDTGYDAYDTTNVYITTKKEEALQVDYWLNKHAKKYNHYWIDAFENGKQFDIDIRR